MGPLLPVAVVADFMQRKQQEDLMRKQQAANILAQRAAAGGAPSYGIQAAQTQGQIDNMGGSGLVQGLLAKRLTKGADKELDGMF